MTTMSLTGNERIAMGGNNPPEPFDLVADEIDALFDESKNWADGEPIPSQAIADAVTKVYDALHEAGKKAEALRVEEVRPLDEAKAAIQAKYHPLIGDTKAGKGKVVIGKAALNQVLSVWRQAEAERKAAIAARERAEAEELRQQAEELMRESAGNLEARIDAEQMLNSAELATKDAKKAEKQATTGLGLRTVYQPVLTDLSAAIKHYWSARREAFEALVTDLAAADVRAGKRTIPGFTVNAIKKAI